MVGLVKCDAFGQHLVPGTGEWEDCPTCNGTGEVPDLVCRHCGESLVREDGGDNFYCPEGCLN